LIATRHLHIANLAINPDASGQDFHCAVNMTHGQQANHQQCLDLLAGHHHVAITQAEQRERIAARPRAAKSVFEQLRLRLA